MIRYVTFLACLSLVFSSLIGCASESRSYPGYTQQQVWTAVVAVSRNPDYSDPLDPTNRWTVVRNDAWVDEPNHRVEIQRELRRVLIRDGAKPLHESREWMFTVEMEPRERPVVHFTIRGTRIPAHGWREEDRFFTDLGSFLEGPAGVRGEATDSTLDAAAP